MDSLDLLEWRKLLDIATRPSVKLQIENIIKTLEPISKIPSEDLKSPAVIYTQLTSFSWDQSAKYLNIIIPLKERIVDVVIDAQEKSVDIKIRTEKVNYQLKLKKLYSAIFADGVTWKSKTDYLQVKIPKANEGRWSSLSESADATKKSPPKPSENDDPQHMIMDLMKNLYNEGDDDMKRTIAKAWTEAMDKKKF